MSSIQYQLVLIHNNNENSPAQPGFYFDAMIGNTQIKSCSEFFYNSEDSYVTQDKDGREVVNRINWNIIYASFIKTHRLIPFVY